MPTTNTFPTNELPNGSPTDDSFPAIKCIIDTAAGLTTGNIRYIPSLAKQYPHTVVRLFAPADYCPIVLSGIARSAKDKEQLATTELDCAFEFHLPFYGQDGATTSIVMATGPNVSVNSILGLPFLKGCGRIIDLVSDVVKLQNLDCAPFAFKMLRPSCYVPEIVAPMPTAAANLATYQSIIDEVDNLVSFMCGNSATPMATSRPSVCFGSTPAPGPSQPASATSQRDSPPLSFVHWTPPTLASTSLDSYYDPLLGGSDHSS